MERNPDYKVNVLLLALIVIDLVLSVWGFFFPDLWFRFWHDAPRVDPQGLLQRCAANWTAFFLFQLIAFFKWKRQPWWLVLVAGMRFGDIFTDVTFSLLCSSLSVAGRVAFPLAGAGNLVFGLLLLRFYRMETSRQQALAASH